MLIVLAPHKRQKYVKKWLSPSLYPNMKTTKGNAITSCSKSNMFTGTLLVTDKKYYVKNELNCSFCNVKYSGECRNCKYQHIESVSNFKQGLSIYEFVLRITKIVVEVQAISVAYSSLY